MQAPGNLPGSQGQGPGSLLGVVLVVAVVGSDNNTANKGVCCNGGGKGLEFPTSKSHPTATPFSPHLFIDSIHFFKNCSFGAIRSGGPVQPIRKRFCSFFSASIQKFLMELLYV